MRRGRRSQGTADPGPPGLLSRSLASCSLASCGLLSCSLASPGLPSPGGRPSSSLSRAPGASAPAPVTPVLFALAAMATVLFAGCGGEEGQGPASSRAEATQGEVRTLEWIDLLPDEDFEALMNPPDWLDEIEEGSDDDVMAEARFSRDEAGRRYWEALHSRNTVASLHGTRSRIPGFVVPLEMDAQNRVIEFFLVPYFGACIHLPPPPPNQMIHVQYPRGLALERLEDAFWVEGELRTVIRDHDLGTAAWGLDASAIRPWPGE